MNQIVEEFNLRPTYQNLEGFEHLPPERLHYLISHAFILAKDQAGCRFLQSQIELKQELFSIVFEATIGDFADLMVDPFGNYLV